MTFPQSLGEAHARAVIAAQPVTVILELTYACNWRCVFCYNPRHHDVKRLSGDEWIAVLDELRALGALTVTLTGGESLAHPDFLRIARAVRERRFAVRIFTNGSLVDETMARAIAELLPSSVEMSVHGATAATHDLATGRPGSFDAMFEGFDRLVAHAARVILKTPLTNLNEGEIDEIMALAESKGAELKIDPQLTPRDDGDLSPLQYRPSVAALERLVTMKHRLGKLSAIERTADGTNCGLGRITMAIDPEGNVYPCMQWRHTSVGNVRKTPLRELWPTSAVRRNAAAVADGANKTLHESGGALAAFPFCPALAFSHTGDPLRASPAHVELADIAARVRERAV